MPSFSISKIGSYETCLLQYKFAYIDRLKKAEKPKEEGVRIAVEIINEVRKVPGVRGVHLMPVMWESITPTIINEAGLLEERTK